MAKLERDIEAYFRRELLRRGAWSMKLVGVKGIPDRLIVLPNGRVVFVELKTERGRLSKVQHAMIRKLSLLGAHVEVLYGQGQVDEFLEQI